MRRTAVVDFETKGIERRPDFPPMPVGVAVMYGNRKKYMAWGHPVENNCTKADAVKVLRELYRDYHVVFHNSAFDIEVGSVHLGLPFPQSFGDSLFLAFLHDPRDESLSLKPLADKYLDMPPDEQTALKDWILENVPEAKQKPSTWGAYISEAPGKLVGKYAIGDVVRTRKIHDLFLKYIQDNGMEESYQRELRLVPIVMKMEQGGIRAHTKRLRDARNRMEKAREEMHKKIKRKLKVSVNDTEFNLGSNVQLADAMERAGKISHWIKTEKGNRSTSRENLEKVCTDKQLLQLLSMSGVLDTYLGTFANPWLASAERNNGYIYPRFNQVRSTDEYGGKAKGTRTGRFSSSEPNFQNVPADVEESMNRDTLLALQKFLKETVELNFIGMRDYLIPDDGCVFIGRDYSQQEIRILAHYEDGALLQAYLRDPKLDVHTFAQELIHAKTGVKYPRKYIKVTGFGIIYGMGAGKLAGQLGISIEEARKLKSAYLSAMPDVRKLDKELKKTGKRDEPIYTWGGRMYFCEEPTFIKGRLQTWEYKLLNLLIQGSAADNTKEAMINVAENCESRIVLQVHDELLNCAKKGSEKREMKLMKEAMEDVQFDIPMLTEGKKSAVSWGRMTAWEG